MTQLGLLLTRLVLALLTSVSPRRRDDQDDRGDVPGWVLVTVMSAGLVMVIWGLASDQLSDMLTTALGSVK